MARKRHKKNRPKTPKLIYQNQEPKVSPAAQLLVNRIVSGGVDYLMDNFIHVMRDSYSLVEEPEFADLFFDEEKVLQATERWLKRYNQRLATAEKEGPEEYHEMFDEMRMEVVAELITPAFRKDVNRRLQALLERLMATDDLEKLELVLFLEPLLSSKAVPWGLCSLILALYQRTVQKAMQAYEQENEIFGELFEEIKNETGDKADLVELLDSPDRLEQLGEKIFANPGLRERAEKQIWDMVEAFEKELMEGKVALDLFTQEELVLPFMRIQEEFGDQIKPVDLPDETRKRLFDIVRETIAEIMTPERLERLRSDVQTTAKTWLRKRYKWAAALQAELSWLEGTNYEENKFVLSAFWGQVKRLGEVKASREDQ